TRSSSTAGSRTGDSRTPSRSSPGARWADGSGPVTHGCRASTPSGDPPNRGPHRRAPTMARRAPDDRRTAARMLRTSDSTDRSATPGVEDDPGRRDDRPPARLLAQRGLFFGPSALVPEDLYSRVERGTARRERKRVVLTPGSLVSTNTYFGRFHATYWQRWTYIGEVEVSAVASGTGRLRLMASDTNKVWRIVAAVDVQGGEDTAVRLVGPIDRFVDGGGMWLEIATETDELTVSDVRWTVAAPRPLAPTDVAITTHNRVDDCLNTLQALASDPEALTCIRTVHVADQGSDPLESRERFAEVAAALGERFSYVRQRNLGGAGGFARGMLH